jgi:hypothetical protein
MSSGGNKSALDVDEAYFLVRRLEGFVRPRPSTAVEEVSFPKGRINRLRHAHISTHFSKVFGLVSDRNSPGETPRLRHRLPLALADQLADPCQMVDRRHSFAGWAVFQNCPHKYLPVGIPPIRTVEWARIRVWKILRGRCERGRNHPQSRSLHVRTSADPVAG